MIIILTVIAYFALTILISIFSKKKMTTSKAYSGIGLGIVLCVFAGAGEWMGGTSTTGVSEYGFLYGISGAWYTIANGLGVCFLAIFFVKFFRRLDTPTVSGIVGKFIGDNARKVSSVLLIIVTMAVGVSQMIAIGSIGETLLRINYAEAILIIGVIIFIYTTLGGMIAVAYTNILHLFVLYGGMLIVLIYCFLKVGSVGELSSYLPASYFSMTSIGMPKVSSWLIASVLGACTAQASLQPVLAAKDEHVAVKSSFIIAAIVAPFGIITAILGMYAKVMFPDLVSGKQALMTVILQIPDALCGFVIAAVIAAILSTLSPILLACGTLFTKDVAGKDSLKFHRGATLVFGLICIVIALIMGDSTVILDVVYFAYGIRGSLFVVLFLAIYWKRTSNKAAVLAMIMTAAVSVFWVVYKNIVGVYPICRGFSETYAGVLTALVVTVVGSIIVRETNPIKKSD